jgi:hypothetical protein
MTTPPTKLAAPAFASSLIAVALIIAPALHAAAQQSGTTTPPETTKPLIVESDTAAVSAKVVAVDHASRTAVLEGPEGRQLSVNVDPSARNFDQVQVGDTVRAQIYTSTVIFIRNSAEPPSATESQAVELAARGGRPGGTMANTRQLAAKVDDVDYQNRVVTLTGPQGNTVRVKVGDNIQNLGEIKPGDQVVLRYTEAVALAVEK